MAASGSEAPTRIATARRSSWSLARVSTPRSWISPASRGRVVQIRILAAYIRSPSGSAPNPNESLATVRWLRRLCRYRS